MSTLEHPLVAAASDGDISQVKQLLEDSANVDIQNEFGATPLICATTKGHLEVVSVLIENLSLIHI